MLMSSCSKAAHDRVRVIGNTRCKVKNVPCLWRDSRADSSIPLFPDHSSSQLPAVKLDTFPVIAFHNKTANLICHKDTSISKLMCFLVLADCTIHSNIILKYNFIILVFYLNISKLC